MNVDNIHSRQSHVPFQPVTCMLNYVSCLSFGLKEFQAPNECESIVLFPPSCPQICLECFSISLEKQVRFSRQCENQGKMLQSEDCFTGLPPYFFLIFTKYISLCSSLPNINFQFSGELKTIQVKHPRSLQYYYPRVLPQRRTQLLLPSPTILFISTLSSSKITENTHHGNINAMQGTKMLKINKVFILHKLYKN